MPFNRSAPARLALRRCIPSLSSAVRARCLSTSSPSLLLPSATFPRVRDSTLDSMLRVDHAGEYGAQCIYNGQLAALALRSSLNLPASPPPTPSSSPSSPPRDPIRVIEEMRDQEVGHLRTLERLLPLHRARPTALPPLWHAAGYALGYGTALLGTRAAMACTVAVEEVIAEHYNDQLRTLASPEFAQAAAQSPATEAEVRELRAVLRKHRDDEEEHRDIGIQHEAEAAPLYSLLTTAIKAGCTVAINVAKVI